MKLAYLITAFNNYEHLDKLIKALDDKNSIFFIHIDKKSDFPSNIRANNNIVFIERINVWWGGWSHQEAILNLMKESTKYKCDYYILISGTDYPIRPNTILYDKLKAGGEYINIRKDFHLGKPESRIKFYYYDCFNRRNRKSLKTIFFIGLEKIQQKIIIKRNYPFEEVYHGSTWWALSYSCVMYILRFLKNHPNYITFFKTSFCPEETLIPTIVGNSEFINNCKGYLTYVDWSKKPAPAIIGEDHIEKFKKQTEFESSYGKYFPFFARKFDDSSSNIIVRIENELRK